jgi:hypothetical protein
VLLKGANGVEMRAKNKSKEHMARVSAIVVGRGAVTAHAVGSSAVRGSQKLTRATGGAVVLSQESSLMDYITLAFYELHFRNAFLERGGDAFQDLFSMIMEKRYPSGDFQRVRPWGIEGDRKNDGYLQSKRVLFQCYAPDDIGSGTSTPGSSCTTLGRASAQVSQPRSWSSRRSSHPSSWRRGPSMICAR